jgi:cytochrome bd-type quinol oxidase subunit 1
MDTATQRLLFRVLFLGLSILIVLIERSGGLSQAQHYKTMREMLGTEADKLKLLDTQ